MPPRTLRETIIDVVSAAEQGASAANIVNAALKDGVELKLASVRACLSANTPRYFERIARGRYRLQPRQRGTARGSTSKSVFAFKHVELHCDDAFSWFDRRDERSVHAIVTDPPYGLLEYSAIEQAKMRNGYGGVWRIPPSYDGHKRAPLPRFTVLKDNDLEALRAFFQKFAKAAGRVCVPGANVLVASNPLVAHIVASAITESGLELRGTIARLVMTMRGGDRPKNAHQEFPDVSVMPRSKWEPWLMFRVPLEGRVQDNLRKWGTGGFRRISTEQPFGDVIKSSPTPPAERKIAPHPSLKPQAFMRQLVRGSLPLGTGVVLDPFAGAGSTLAAANAVGYTSVGIEIDPDYFKLAQSALPKLSQLSVEQIDPLLPELGHAITMKRGGARSEFASGVLPEIGLRNIS